MHDGSGIPAVLLPDDKTVDTAQKSEKLRSETDRGIRLTRQLSGGRKIKREYRWHNRKGASLWEEFWELVRQYQHICTL